MVQTDRDAVLAETESVTGHTALRDNVKAAVALSNAVRSTLGPKGLDKLLVGTDGSAMVTNDGVSVLEAAEVKHQTALMLIGTSRAQDDEVRDGTSSTVVLIAELLVNALQLVERGVHPAVVAQGYNMCEDVVDDTLSAISRDADVEAALQAVRTALAGKGDAGFQAILAQLAHDAARKSGTGETEHVRIITQKSGAIGDSELVQGLVLEKTRVHREMELKPEPGRILILDGGLEKRKPEIDATLLITNTGTLAAFHARDRADLQARVDALKEANIDCLIARDGIEEEAHPMLAAAGILAYRRVERPEIEHLCRATGARPVLDIDDIRDEDVGRFQSIREEKRLGTQHLILEGSQTAGITVVLRGSSKMRLDEASRAFDDALGVACQLVDEPRLLPGGGATHIALARRLRRHAETIPGREQMGVEAFAAALEVIPRALAENAGLDPIDSLLRATAAQAESDSAWQGLDITTGKVTDMGEAAVTEPIRITRHAISGATEAAISVLRIDDIVWAKQDAQEPDWQTED
jgi:chaperonin GroEL (HSP60 family)